MLLCIVVDAVLLRACKHGVFFLNENARQRTCRLFAYETIGGFNHSRFPVYGDFYVRKIQQYLVPPFLKSVKKG